MTLRVLLLVAALGAAVSKTLPPDIPAYPEATLAEARTSEAVDIFVLRVRAGVDDINRFYTSRLADQRWQKLVESSNGSDGLYFTRNKRWLRVIAVNVGGGNSEIHLLTGVVSHPEPTFSLGPLIDDLEYPKSIPSDVPTYKNARAKETTNPQKWREFESRDSVSTISSWYAKRMKSKGWSVHFDNSEHGDSMVVYTKPGPEKVPRYIGVRINNRGDYRNLTIILYAKGVIVPKLDPRSH